MELIGPLEISGGGFADCIVDDFGAFGVQLQ